MPSSGTTTATIASARASTPRMSPSPKAAASCADCACTDAQAVASSRGSDSTISSIENDHQRDDDEHPER